MLLMAVFAGLALALAMVGIYGVMSYSVTQATQEIGIRMALGAGSGDVLRMVLSYGGTLMAVGLLIGVPMALGAGKLLASQHRPATRLPTPRYRWRCWLQAWQLVPFRHSAPLAWTPW